MFTTPSGSAENQDDRYSWGMEMINRNPAAEPSMAGVSSGRTPRPMRELRPLSRMERFELAKRRMRMFVLFSMGTASAACLLVYGAYLMTTRILLPAL